MENIVDGSIVFEIKVRIERNGELRYNLIYQMVGEEYGIPGIGYSIEISSNIQGESEYVFLEDISREYLEAVDIITEFAKNTVTPESALYITEDLLS